MINLTSTASLATGNGCQENQGWMSKSTESAAATHIAGLTSRTRPVSSFKDIFQEPMNTKRPALRGPLFDMGTVLFTATQACFMRAFRMPADTR
jgi:hypothetical protein